MIIEIRFHKKTEIYLLVEHLQNENFSHSNDRQY